MLHVQWRGFDETEATWEPLDQLNEDVPEKVAAYVKDTAAPALTEALKKCKPKRKRKGGRTYANAAAASAGSQVTDRDGSTAAAMASSATASTDGTMTHTEARSARAAARAARNDRRNRSQRNDSKTKGKDNRRRRR